LVEAVRRKLCTQIYCTTCGALEFRNGVLDALSLAAGQPRPQRLERECAVEIARALAGVVPAADDSMDLAPAVRCLLFDLWNRNEKSRRCSLEAGPEAFLPR
jgi:hypothetical protein